MFACNNLEKWSQNDQNVLDIKGKHTTKGIPAYLAELIWSQARETFHGIGEPMQWNQGHNLLQFKNN